MYFRKEGVAAGCPTRRVQTTRTASKAYEGNQNDQGPPRDWILLRLFVNIDPCSKSQPRFELVSGPEDLAKQCYSFPELFTGMFDWFYKHRSLK